MHAAGLSRTRLTGRLQDYFIDSGRAYLLFPAVWAACWKSAQRIKSRSSILARQTRRLRRTIAGAAAQVPYYRRTFAEHGLEPGDIADAFALDRLPLLSRETFQDYAGLFVAENRSLRLCELNMTSGTTGRPLEIIKSLQSAFSLYVRMQTRSGQLGVPADAFRWLGGSYVYISDCENRPQFRRFTSRMPIWKLSRFEKFDIRRESDAASRAMIQEIAKLAPVILIGRPLALSALSNLIERVASNRSCIRPRVILTGAEHLLDQVRDRLQETFGCPVFDSYGLTEVGLVGCECRARSGLHFEDDEVIVEIVRDGKRVSPGEDGEIVVTDLSNPVMPFIRYRSGDIGRVTYEECSCGLPYPRLTLIEGRILDLFVDAEGKAFNPLMLQGSLPVLGLRQYQLVQKSPREIQVRYVGSTAPENVVGAVIEAVRCRMGSGSTVTAVSVGSIDIPGRKTRIYVNEIPKAD